PKGVKGRKEFGHWEIDVVKGTRRTKACLLTLSERKTRQEIICKMNSCKGEEVDKVITEMEKRLGSNFRKIFKTITADNGSEFLDWEELERSKIKGGGRRTKIYYAHPYSSFERGTNENQNRMIRRFINKGTDIGKVTRKTVRAIQNWINSYPRAILNYKTSNNITSQFLTKKTCEILGVVQ
ncbi:MAG: IS30 family transposase, partial [Candidatus Goldbacteria bacterium]|nr:IS30 family transposase [Candidatus Goldiibacteriota bacterium]